MIILDTNIVSVIFVHDHPDQPLIDAWRRASLDQDIRVTAISRAEIDYGIAILPDGARKRRLSEAADEFLAPLMGFVLPFGVLEAEVYGTIMASRLSKGRSMGVLDAQIAAIATVAGATVATCDTRDFLDCGVRVINPYEHMSGNSNADAH